MNDLASPELDVKHIHEQVAQYYGKKLATHGPVAAGVDWRDEASQVLRFEQLAHLFRRDPTASVADIGCGYGAFLKYIRQRGHGGLYIGLDVSPEMIDTARQMAADASNYLFDIGEMPSTPVDYVVASGIFNVRLDFDAIEWNRYIEGRVDAMNSAASRGLAFNCLSLYSDVEKRRPDLHYADPLFWFDRCKRRYGRNVALFHDYDLYEFTIVVRK